MEEKLEDTIENICHWIDEQLKDESVDSGYVSDIVNALASLAKVRKQEKIK